ncbi:MAG: PAS domain S-box protein [Coleofasciculus sp. B1-GNL1-01]|uniref:PAS domain S-box protein n=1 Tax=Coleofasciculus sp. B1-GNL1-01 TaxID=3068484 RepID=UPI0032FE4056
MSHQPIEPSSLKNEQCFRTIFEASPLGIAIVGLNQHFIKVNPLFCQIVGYSASELTQLRFTDITHPDDRKLSLQREQQLSQGKLSRHRIDKRYIRKDGEVVEVHLSGSIIRDQQNNPLYYLKMIEEISERQQTQPQALLKEQEFKTLKSRFIARVSHEFRTPLSQISLFTQLLERYDERWSIEQKADYFRRIHTSITSMTQLLDDVLFIGKADAEKVRSTTKLFDLASFLERMITEVQQRTQQKCSIQWRNPSFSLPVYLDPTLVERIMINLLDNAVKYSVSGDTVYIGLTRDHEQVTLQIQDQGIGIPAEDLPYLFESFHRGKNIGNRPGTGLGLTIVKQCVDVQQGQIEITSEIGVGTTVTLIFPVTSWNSSHDQDFGN